MLRWVYALVISAVSSGFAFLLVTGHYIDEGEVVTSFTPDHGLHEGDIFVLLGWAISIIAVLALTLSSGRTRE